MMNSSNPPTLIFSELSLVFELLQIDETKFPKSFKARHPISNALHPLIFQCPLCRIINSSGKCGKKTDLWELECHVRKQHKGFVDHKTKLSCDKTLALIKILKSILFLGLIS